jgi:glutamate--cysteine ligase
MDDIAKILDSANDTDRYSSALALEKQKVLDPSLTPSAKILSTLLEQNQDNGTFGLQLADQYKQKLLNSDYRYLNEQALSEHARQSTQKQQQIEQQDTLSFDEFLTDYFAN